MRFARFSSMMLLSFLAARRDAWSESDLVAHAHGAHGWGGQRWLTLERPLVFFFSFFAVLVVLLL